MNLYTIEDTKQVDAFKIPSIFEDKLPLYKEWHDFVFFDRKEEIFGLLNFGIHGNPYDIKRGYGTVLSYFVNPQGKIHAERKVIPLRELHVSRHNPDYISKKATVTYQNDNSFKIKGNLEKSSFNLKLPINSPPNTNKGLVIEILGIHQKVNNGMFQAATEMARLWDNWVEIPKLYSNGEITLDNTTFPINTRTSYHDHEGGRFDWSSPFGWDTGNILCDPMDNKEPETVRFLFYRYGPSENFSYGGIIFQTKNGQKKYFDSEKIQITRTGKFSGENKIVPGITRLLYPDYHPYIPERIVFSVINDLDKLEIVFTPKAICSVIAASILGTAETELNEIYCSATIKGNIGDTIYDKTIPCWFESARPRGSVSYALEA